MQGKLVVISGFPASGKDTLANLLAEKRSEFKKIVSYSSRPIRKTETHGVDHFFVTKVEFENLLKEEKMFEHTISGSFYKGTSKEAFKMVLEGKSVIWRVDPHRMAFLEETFYEKFDKKTAEMLLQRTVKIFIRTYQHKTLLKRYFNRGSEEIEEFKKRLEDELKIFNKYKHRFPNVVFNKHHKQLEALREIEKIIDSH